MVGIDSDGLLFAAGADGALIVLRIVERSSSGVNHSQELKPISTQVLMQKQEYLDLVDANSQTQLKIEELKLHFEYQKNLLHSANTEKLSSLQVSLKQEIEAMEAQLEHLNSEKSNLVSTFEKEVKAKRETHQQNVRKRELEMQTVLAKEIELTNEIEQQMEKKNGFYQKQHEKTLLKQKDAEETLEAQYEHQLRQSKEAFAELQTEYEVLLAQTNEAKKQLEEQFNAEYNAETDSYEEKIRLEKASSLKLKGENSLLQKKFISIKREIESKNEDIKSMNSKFADLVNDQEGIEAQIKKLKKDIKQRDNTISSKEKLIYDLKKKNQELEKFKFVLDFQIKEMKNMIEPRAAENGKLQVEIDNMDSELESYHHANLALDKMIGDLRQSLDALQEQLNQGRDRIFFLQSQSELYKSLLEKCVEKIQHPEELKARFEKFAEHFNIVAEEKTDVSEKVFNEFSAQKLMLQGELKELKDKYYQQIAIISGLI